MGRKVVVHHGDGCRDGWLAAYLLWHHWAADDLIAANYGDPLPAEVEGNEFMVVDFSYPRPLIEELHRRARSVVVLDHHASAQADLAGLPYCYFASDRSGARMAWDWLVAHHYARSENQPWLVGYVEDLDLWHHELPDTEVVNAVVRSYPLTLAAWDELDLRDPKGPVLLREGQAILRAEQRIVEAHVERAREVVMDGERVLAVNATVLWSQVANELARERPFAACWRELGGRRKWDLRSTQGVGADVGAIAVRRGGGGHRHAAGFVELLEAPLPPDADGEREEGQGVPGQGNEDEGERHRRSLPAKAEQIDAFVRTSFEANGYGPTYREIGRAVGLRSTSTVTAHVQSLIHAGRLRLLPNRRGVVPA